MYVSQSNPSIQIALESPITEQRWQFTHEQPRICELLCYIIIAVRTTYLVGFGHYHEILDILSP